MAEDNAILQLPHESVKKSLDGVIKEKGLMNYEIELSMGSNKGDNYGGIVYRIRVTGVTDCGKTEHFYLFCKVPVEMEGFRNEIELHEGFLREIKFYNEIVKDLESFQADKHVKDRFNAFALCFATGSTKFEEFLIMEDITKRDFTMFDRMKQLDFNHTQLVMKTLGKLHAFSFALRDQKPEIFQKYSKELFEVFMKENMSPTFKKLVDNFVQSSIDKLKFEGIYQEKWEHFYTNFYKNVRECCKGELAEPFAVVGHGDCWNNNMMFKYENGIPNEVCLLDWQECRYASPILDLAYYIFCGTDKTFRDEHYQSLLNIYYHSLSSFLKELGSDPDKLFPYSEFQNQWKKFGKFGLGMALLIVPVILTNPEDAVPFSDMADNVSGATDNEKTFKIWTTRVSDVLTDVVDLGYL